jgi:hypothetical protein
MIRNSLLSVFSTHKFPIIITIGLIILSYASPENDLKLYLGLMVIIPIFTIYRFDGRIPLGIGILTLVLADIVLSLNQESLARELAIRCYFLLIAGVSCLIIELFRKKGTNMKIFKNEYAS